MAEGRPSATLNWRKNCRRCWRMLPRFKDAAEWLEFAAVCQAKQRYAGAGEVLSKPSRRIRAWRRIIVTAAAVVQRRGGGARRERPGCRVSERRDPRPTCAGSKQRRGCGRMSRVGVAVWKQAPLSSATTCVSRWSRCGSIRPCPPCHDDAALEKLPEEERAFRQLWRNVAELSQRAWREKVT